MTNSDSETAARLSAVRGRILAACRAAGRAPDSVRLLAVSKTRSAAEIRALHACGIAAFGENYVDEAEAKAPELADLALEWHFIGPLQSNKTQRVASLFDWVQSVDRDKIVHRLAAQRPADRVPLNVLIQVNIDAEPQKAGCAPDRIDQLADIILEQPRLALRGLMAIPAAAADGAARSAAFERMRVLFETLALRADGIDTLSMGMSADLEPAIQSGSTLVRVGTALFGPRR
ncbi:MAG: YggS family pyridoxal phosphate-dependent enzyme [Gammaproteobacteria bacterium HGW-Gammaproteobacteria-8]|nr:MAG: YggS family pyridoxal phosphate-dependent enzyme [Gammaproteobacteria bacterium HGW-Gammaproteobacteria-8]